MALAAFGLVFLLGGVLGGGKVGAGSVPVVVAAKDIQIRNVIQESDVKVVGFAAGDVNASWFHDVKQVKGTAAQVKISAGQPISANEVLSSPDLIVGPQPFRLPSGFVALTIPTNEQLGVGGYVQAGDYLTVIATVNANQFAVPGQPAPPSRTVIKTVFTNLHILKVGPAAVTTAQSGQPQQQQQAGVSSSLTVLMTQCDAEFMTWFLNSGASLKYTLESSADYLKTPPSKPDPQCPSITGTRGVSAADVEQRWQFTKA